MRLFEKPKKVIKRRRRKQVNQWVEGQAANSDNMMNTLKHMPIYQAPVASKSFPNLPAWPINELYPKINVLRHATKWTIVH